MQQWGAPPRRRPGPVLGWVRGRRRAGKAGGLHAAAQGMRLIGGIMLYARYSMQEPEPGAGGTGLDEGFAPVGPVPGRSFNLIQSEFLARLERLKKAREQLSVMPDADPLTVKLVARGLFATYQECLDQGVGHEARAILELDKTR
jgi:hypothetical protein